MGGAAGTEMKVPNGDGMDLEGLRMHADDKGLDEIHFHDDKGGLKFTYKGRRAFSVGMDRLLGILTKKGKGSFVIQGEPGVSAADLLIEKKATGWKTLLIPKGSKTSGVRFGCDKTLAKLDDFIHRI